VSELRIKTVIVSMILSLMIVGLLQAQSENELRLRPKKPDLSESSLRTVWPDANCGRVQKQVAMRTEVRPLPLVAYRDGHRPVPIRREMSISQLQGIARCNNPTLGQAARRIEALRGKYVQDGLYPNPIVGYIAEDMGALGTSGKQGGFVGQEIVTAGKLKFNRAVVSHEIDMARREWEIQYLRVTNDVQAGACKVIAAQRMIALDKQLVQIGEQGLSAAEQLFEAKEVSRIDVIQARIEANTAKLQLENSQNDHRARWQELTAIVGIPNMQTCILQDTLNTDLPEQNWEEALTRLMGSSPELSRAYAEVERARCFLARQRVERVPNFEIGAGVEYDNIEQTNLASVIVSAPLKIFDRNQGNIRMAESELIAAKRNLCRQKLALRERLAAVFEQHANAKQQVDMYRNQILIDANDSLELVQHGYRQGEYGYLELLTSQRTYFQSHVDYVKSLESLWVSNTMIEGMLISGGLKSPEDYP